MNIWLTYTAWLTLFSFVLRVSSTTYQAVTRCFMHLLYSVHLIFYANQLPTSGSMMLIRNIAVTLYFCVGKGSSPKQGEMLCAQIELENSALNSVNWAMYWRSSWTFRRSKPSVPSSLDWAPVFPWASSGVGIFRGRLSKSCALSASIFSSYFSTSHLPPPKIYSSLLPTGMWPSGRYLQFGTTSLLISCIPKDAMSFCRCSPCSNTASMFTWPFVPFPLSEVPVPVLAEQIHTQPFIHGPNNIFLSEDNCLPVFWKQSKVVLFCSVLSLTPKSLNVPGCLSNCIS